MANTPISSFRFNPEWKTWVESVAQAEGLNLTDAIREALTEWALRKEQERRKH